MVGQMPGNSSHPGIAKDVISIHMPEDPQCCPRKWYFSREEIENHSPSKKDGIDLKTESQMRKLYCSFLQDIGMKLKVPQLTIATAIMLCHRFFMRQSHAKNDWQTVATVSMFLACKVEETPRMLQDVVHVAYVTIYRWDPSAPRRIRQTEVCEKQKELVLVGEKLLLETVAFDLNIEHPYRPLVRALKKLEISHNDIAKVAWNFVNDWLCTTLCLQYKPHYIAAGSLFLAAKFHKVKLPTEKGGKVWWLEFDISPKQLEEVIQQMLRRLEQNRKQTVPPPTCQKVTDSTGKAKESPQSCISTSSTAPQSSKAESSKPVISKCTQNQASVSDSHVAQVEEVFKRQTSDSGGSANSGVENVENVYVDTQLRTEESGENTGFKTVIADEIVESGENDTQPRKTEDSGKIVTVDSGKLDVDRIKELIKRRRSEGGGIKKVEPVDEIDANSGVENVEVDTQPRRTEESAENSGLKILIVGENVESGENDTQPRKTEESGKILTIDSSKLDVDRIKERIKRRRNEGGGIKKVEPIDEIERELENGIELDVNRIKEKIKRRRSEGGRIKKVEPVDEIERELEIGIELECVKKQRVAL